jgi:Heterokaryon incompatibility protein (HET)
LGEDPKSDEQISALRGWLTNCLDHPKCSKNLSGTEDVNPRKTLLPTRCIDVGSEILRLKETGHETGSYVILSHRWGPEVTSSQTSTTNYAARTKLLWEPLPKTFQDAIWITRCLGERYLWIDSICIIQEGDEKRDWGKEAKKMAQYYQNSLVTIAATGCSEKHGLFPPATRPKPYNVVQLPYRNSSGKHQGKFYVYQCDDQVEVSYGVGVPRSELLQRGWVFQEWMLSRRLVCYTKRGVFYQCQTDPPRNENCEFIGSDVWGGSMAQFTFLKPHFNFEAARSLDKLWRELIEAYSGRHLTFPEKDRILALAGVAEEFKMALNHRSSGQGSDPVDLKYGYGLWLRDIHRGLLWEMEPDSSGATEKLENMPTWSWASRMVGVRWSDRERPTEHTCEVVGLGNTKDVMLAVGDVGDNARRSEKLVDNMFAALLIRCRRQKVHIQRRLEGEEEIKEASTVTGHSFGSKHWRAVSSLEAPAIISGWASIEDHTLEKQLSSCAFITVQALHVSTTRGIAGGLKLGYFWPSHSVFNVLFVEDIDGHGRKFRRLGCGVLYGKDMSQGFQKAVEGEIELV